MKFVNYICSYTAFLVLLFFTTALTSTNSVDLFAGTEGVVHSLIMFYVIGASTVSVVFYHSLCRLLPQSLSCSTTISLSCST